MPPLPQYENVVLLARCKAAAERDFFLDFRMYIDNICSRYNARVNMYAVIIINAIKFNLFAKLVSYYGIPPELMRSLREFHFFNRD